MMPDNGTDTSDSWKADYAAERALSMREQQLRIERLKDEPLRFERYEALNHKAEERRQEYERGFLAHLKRVNETNRRIADASERQANALEAIARAIENRNAS